ncbi:hypothetical protein ABMA27_008832 [Loxostege sticticalis]|uniref:DDE Tnp4 domain-containing protein n=1 Tax=Loxostege sticticalis TaxID=481309 RepID=A0ABR3H988_LOXSC
MEVDEAICLWILYRRLKKRRGQRRYWVHPILRDRTTLIFNYFRMSIATFDYLENIIENDLRMSENAVRYCISPKERFIVTLSLGYSYRLNDRTVSQIVNDVSDAIWKHMQPIFMPVPTQESWKTIAAQFEEKWHFPNCCGSLDGKHVTIIKPGKTN